MGFDGVEAAARRRDGRHEAIHRNNKIVERKRYIFFFHRKLSLFFQALFRLKYWRPPTFFLLRSQENNKISVDFYGETSSATPHFYFSVVFLILFDLSNFFFLNIVCSLKITPGNDVCISNLLE